MCYFLYHNGGVGYIQLPVDCPALYHHDEPQRQGSDVLVLPGDSTRFGCNVMQNSGHEFDKYPLTYAAHFIGLVHVYTAAFLMLIAFSYYHNHLIAQLKALQREAWELLSENRDCIYR